MAVKCRLELRFVAFSALMLLSEKESPLIGLHLKRIILSALRSFCGSAEESSELRNLWEKITAALETIPLGESFLCLVSRNFLQ